MSLEGAYGIATKDAMPNVAGGNLSIFNYIETGSIVHQISLNGGILAGSHHPSVHDLGISGPYTASVRSTYVPMMAGYTLNLPIGDYTMFYLGGKAAPRTETLKPPSTGWKTEPFPHHLHHQVFLGSPGRVQVQHLQER